MTVAEFRAAFPQFGEELFPAARVEFYLALAAKRLSPERWDDLLPEGTGLFVAHYLTLEKVAATADGAGAFAAAAGPVVSASKSVGGVAVSEGRAGAAASGYAAAGQWNNTLFGQQFYELVQLVGAGGAQV